MERLIEELQSYQHQLERQNEALRASQKALKKAHDRLEERVAERTAELETANRQLRETVKEKTRIAESLAVSETRYRSLVESTDDFIYLVNEKGEYLFMNSRMRSFYNLAPEGLSGRRYGDFHDEGETFAFMEWVRQVMENKASLHQGHYQNGHHYLRTLSPVKEKDGTVRSVTVVSKDITDEAKLQADLVRSNQRLRHEQVQRIRLSKRVIELLEEDRRRIAGDLHDHVGQSLTSLKLSLEQVVSEIPPGNEMLRGGIADALQKATHVLHDIKNISRELRPPVLDTFGLVQSLMQLLKGLERKGIKTHFFEKGVPRRFQPEKELAFYRIAQEATQNIMKHADASDIYLNLLMKGQKVCMSVEDNGSGFDPKELDLFSGKKSSLGLMIMRERAFQLKGDLTIESAKGKGTHLLVEIPLEDS